MTRTLAVAFLALGLAVPGAAEPAFKVRRRDLATVYLDAGSEPTLRRGDRLRVMAGAATVAEMEVVQVVVGGSAACRVLSATRPVIAGDVAVLVTPSPSGPPAAAAIAKAAPWPSPSPVRAALDAAPPPVAVPAAPAPIPPSPARASAPASSPSPSPSPWPSTAPSPSPSPSPSPEPRATAIASLAGSGGGGNGGGHGNGGGGSGGGGNGGGAVPKTAPVPVLVPPRVGRREFRVKYRSAANAYIDGGKPDGLTVGDLLRILGGKDTVAELEVVHLSEQSASCRIVMETRPVRVDDVVVRTAAAVASAAANTAIVTATPPVTTPPGGPRTEPRVISPQPAVPFRRRDGRWAQVRGSASVGYMRSWDRTPLALDLEERTGRLDLGLYDIAGQPLSFSARLRSRQNMRPRPLAFRTPQEERNDSLYELAVRYQPRSDSYGLEVGRIGLYRFVSIGYLDGALARRQFFSHFELGGFAGREAEVGGFGATSAPSGEKYGAFVRLTPGGRYAMGGFDGTLAAVRETAAGAVSREYLSLESRLGRGSRWSLSERAELDLNRGWRRELTGKGQQLSNVSLSGHLRLSASASAYASYDGRRNYRYERNRLVSPDLFDGLYYQGLRAGLNVARPAGMGLSLGGGMRMRSPDPNHPELSLANAYSVNGGVRHSGLFGRSLSLGVDGSGFTNGYTKGGVASANLGQRFGTRHYLDLSYGRSFYRVTLTGQDRVTEWRRVMGRFELGRHVYLTADVSYDTGDDVDGLRGFLETGFVF